MIYLRFHADGHNKYGILEGKTVVEIDSSFFGAFKKTGRKYPLSKVTLLPPCHPSKIVAMGLNYIDHARELRMPIPLYPLIFMKPSTAVIGTGEKIIYPKGSKRVDYEAELAVVIKKRAKNVSAKKAMEYVQGFTCLNDVTARDFQKYDLQWTRAKSFDTFAPIGPWIVDGIDPNNLKIEAFLNNKCVQRSNTSELIFRIDEIISFVSSVMTLLPGDIISTGTPPGIGPMVPGDDIKVKIQKIGTLENIVA